MRAGQGSAVAVVPAEAAFAWLADPRHADQWFAGVALAAPPEGTLRAGSRWRFGEVRGVRGEVHVRMAAYEPPQRFRWETVRRWPADNLAWEVRLAVVDTEQTRIEVEVRQMPGPLAALATVLVARRMQRALDTQAQRAAERAAEAAQASAATARRPGRGRASASGHVETPPRRRKRRR